MRVVRAVQAVRAEQAAPEVRRGGRGAGGAMLGTMADAYANSIMVDALILGREGTITVPDTNYYAPALPANR